MEVRELDSPPALAPLYAKAALGSALPGGGDRPPDHALGLAEIQVDRERVADYCAACGFALRDAVPVTYPHVLGFPLAMALMTERSFPFSLLGLVHVANRITQVAPLAIDGRPALRVWAENLRPHRRGRQLEVVTEARVGDEAVWREHSTYLRPGGSGEPRATQDGEGGASKWPAEPRRDRLAGAAQVAVWNLGGDVGRRYAEVSGDRNPIHLHGVSARLLGFPGAIAHGMWTLAHALASLEGRLPESTAVQAEFRAPLRIPGRARLLWAIGAEGWEVGVESLDRERRHLDVSVRG